MSAEVAALEEFRERYPFDDDAFSYLLKVGPEVQEKVLTHFRPKREGESDYSSLIMSFTKRCRLSASDGRQRHGDANSYEGPTEEEVDEFCRRYPIDEAALRYLHSSPPAVQARALRDFRAKREGESDYSAIFITFCKICRGPNPSAAQVVLPRASPSWRPSPVQAPVTPWHYQEYPSHHQRAVAPYPSFMTQAQGVSARELAAFSRLYPMDEAARRFILESPPYVQELVLDGFKPKREGEGDYSALIIAFTKKCRMDHIQVGEFERFRMRYPIDEAASNYLHSVPREVQAQVFHHFKPKNEGDSDYSALVIAFTKRCREVGVAPLVVRPPKGQESLHYPRPREEEEPAGLIFEDAIHDFFNRYPCDERARQLLHGSSEEVIDRVLREFRVKREGETDYSAALVAYVHRCRTDQAMKRPRYV